MNQNTIDFLDATDPDWIDGLSENETEEIIIDLMIEMGSTQQEAMTRVKSMSGTEMTEFLEGMFFICSLLFPKV